MKFLHFMRPIRISFVLILLLAVNSFADYQIKSNDVRVDSSLFSKNLSSEDNTVQKALDRIDNLTLGTAYNASGTLLNLSDNTFSIKEGTLTTNKGCKYVSGTGLVCDQDYLTSFTETDPVFSSWDKSTGISITESQISDLQDYLTAETDPKVGNTTSGNFCKGTGTQVSCTDSNTYLTSFTESDPLSLHLSQATPQTISGGAPIFDGGLDLNDNDKIRLGTGKDVEIYVSNLDELMITNNTSGKDVYFQTTGTGGDFWFTNGQVVDTQYGFQGPKFTTGSTALELSATYISGLSTINFKNAAGASGYGCHLVWDVDTVGNVFRPDLNGYGQFGNSTYRFGDAYFANMYLTTGKSFTIGTTQWNSGDSIDGTKVANADLGDIGVSSGVWSVEDDSHTHTTTFDLCFYFDHLAAGDDNVDFRMWAQAVTITKVGCYCDGTCTTAAQISLEDRAGNAMTHTTPTCATGTDNATYQSVTANGSLAAGEGLNFDVDNTPNPETDLYLICVQGTYDD